MTPRTMNDKLQEALQRANQLTRAGRLAEATAAIQQALQRSAPESGHRTRPPTAVPVDAEVIDVEARVVDDAPPSRPRPPPAGAAADGPTGHAAGSHHAAAGLPSPGAFEAGLYANAAGQRAHKLYRPRNAPADGQRPALVVMLHGCTQNPDDFAAGTRMNALAEARGWWVLYPAQSTSANSSGCWNWFKPGDQRRGIGEPAILAGMTADLVERAGIDPARVFVAGLSAGGAMAVTLAATHPELFAAVGVHSGLPHGSAHDLMSALSAMRQGAARPGPGHRVPTIVFHGDQDTTVHPCNGTEVVRQARGPGAQAADGRQEGPVETERSRQVQGHRYTRSVHRDGHGRVDAEHWLIHGAGHAWSGGSPAGSYTDPLGPDASTEMLRFFSEATA